MRKVEEDEAYAAAAPTKRLIVVANRLPVTPRRARDGGGWRFERSSGGLVSAFLGVKNMEITWVGWVGVPVPEDERADVTESLAKQEPFSCIPVYLDAETADHFYNGFCNNVLWPLLHYIPLSMLDSQASVAELQWLAYQRANQAFADTVMSLQLSDTDLVWVQDYHLMLLPKNLRERNASMNIGWFLHTPFATSEMYRTLPHREEILRGVLGADLVGFHIYDYARHFHTACSRVLGTGGSEGVTEGNEGIFDHFSRRSIAVDAFPIGIDPSRFEACLETPLVKDKIIDLQRRFDGKKVLLGIDRLDYVKGIPHKLKAIECFLRAHPQWMGKIVLLQIAVPSRTEVPGYQKLRNNVHKLVGRINGEFGSLDNVPIHYLDQSMTFPELCALYFRADCMFVTSLRDGMNLVSFEYIACQKKRSGVLVLSEFAGAAQALGAGALLVNPYNTDEVASALHEALNMPLQEREQRFDYMFAHINQHTAQTWAEKFVGSLRHAHLESSNYDMGPFSGLEESSELPQRDVIASYKACERKGGKRLLVFGLLGTLIDYSHFVSLEHLLPSVRRNLAEIAASPQNTVIVCSGRERALMNEWLGDLPIWLVAENGLFIRPPPAVSDAAMSAEAVAEPEWEMSKEDLDLAKEYSSLKPVFKYFEARTPDSFTEVQEYTMTWHFQSADEEFAEVQAGDLQAHLVKVSGHAPVEVSLDMKRVEVRPYGVSKGAAIATILEKIQAEEAAAIEASNGVNGGGPSGTTHTPTGGLYDPPASEAPPSPNKSDDSKDNSPDGANGHWASPEPAPPPSLPHSGNGNSSAPTSPPSIFKWVFCASEVLARDEDLFSNLQALSDLPSPTHTPPPDAGGENGGSSIASSAGDLADAPRVFTCCVGKTLSQADFHIGDADGSGTNEVAGLLDLLAHASLDAAGSPALGTTLEDEEAPAQTDLPSTLERLHSLVKLLAGKQLLIIMDYDSCSEAIQNPSKDLARFLKAYPTAVVQRTALPDNGGDALRESNLGTGESLGSISGVQIVSFGSSTAAAPSAVPAFGTGHARSGSDGGPGGLVRRESDDGAEGDGAAPAIEIIDSYRPALESCFEVLQTKLSTVPQVSIEDNTFSLTVTHRGAEESEAEDVRELVRSLLADEYPMLRFEDERTQLNVRPDPGWNRARMVEWLVSQVVDSVKKQLSVREVMPIYLGEDPAFRHLPAVGGLDILITGGPAIDSYFLRATSQVDQLLRWFAEQHAAGVTVRGGRLRPPKSMVQHHSQPGASSLLQSGKGGGQAARSGPVKRVQILQQDGQRAAPATNPPTTGSTGSSSSTRPRGSSLEDPPAPIS